MGTGNTTSTAADMTEIIRNVHIVTLVMFCVVLVVGIVGNGLVIYVTGCRMKRTVNSVWFLNLAVADFLFIALLIFTIISFSQEGEWQFGKYMCKLNTFVGVVNMFASIFLLTAISLDRCLSTWVVVWAQNKRTVCKAKIICAVVWITAVVCSAPYATFRELREIEGKMYCTYSVTQTQYWTLNIFRFVVGFLIPFLVICVSYVAIGVRAGRLQRTRKKRSRRIIFSVILAFFICWLPFHVMCLIEITTTNPDIRNIVRIAGPLILSLAFMNSCLNPILYVFMCDEFQKKLRQSICFVLESALAEDHLSFMSSRSLSSHFSRITRRSDSNTPVEKTGTGATLNFTESNAVITAETETVSSDEASIVTSLNFTESKVVITAGERDTEH
ncbi:C3a anaphylatoxin chemotactic receptor-like [Sebastes umbrosus]|uniref:C3a anaphylatoxin chemotactic receptor-like n=1 Tax=Sebastes umbrosus TaxID=72105 RepID=UPI00189CA491|nr:C3a anaphylatoxin chemotactic receptor-like [Sebastes umbrosus]